MDVGGPEPILPELRILSLVIYLENGKNSVPSLASIGDSQGLEKQRVTL